MKTGPIVLIGWGAALAALTTMLAGFGGSAIPLWIFGGAAAIIELFAGTMILSIWRHPAGRTSYRVPTRGEVGFLGGVGLALVALGVSFGAWFFPMAAVTLWLALRAIFMDWHRRRHLSR